MTAESVTSLVRQEDTWGCMVASVAMAMGRTYQETKALFHPWFFTREQLGIGETEAVALLSEHGYAVAIRHEHYHPACCHRPTWPPQPWTDVHICEVETSMSHAVVMLRDGRVLDPYYGERPSLSQPEYKRVFKVIGVHRVGDPLPEFVGPTTEGRRKPPVCSCQGAWDKEGTTVSVQQEGSK